MESQSQSVVAGTPDTGVARLGFWVAALVASVTVVTFALALTALPDKVPYPFTDPVIAKQWPGDYLWLYPAMLLMLLVVAWVAAIHAWAHPSKQVFSLVGLCAAVGSAAVLLIDYFLQASVMQISLEKGQRDGWAMLTQYNPNGVFIALEELGYLLMSVAFLCLSAAFGDTTRIERALRWLLRGSFAVTVLAFAVISAVKGMDRADTFEIVVISIVWLTLIAAGILTAILFRREARA